MRDSAFHCRTRRVLVRIGEATLSAAILLGAWSLASFYVVEVKGSPFPGPLESLASLCRLLAARDLIYEKTIWVHIGQSVGRWLSGYGAAVVAGIGIGALAGSSNVLYRVLMPVVYAVQLVPGIAWIPIALLLFGLGNPSTVFMVGMVAVGPVAVSAAVGIRSTPRKYLWAARMMGAGSARLFFQVVVPSCILSILNGLRIGLANAWRVLVAAEMIVGTGVGLGYIIIESRWSFRFRDAFVCIMIICSIGLLVEKVFFAAIEGWAMHRMGLSRKES